MKPSRDQDQWSLRRLKSVSAELQAGLMKGVELSPDTLAALSEMTSIPDDLIPRAAHESGRVSGHVMGVVLRRGRIAWPILDRMIKAVKVNEASAGLARDLVAYLKTAQRLDRHVAVNKLVRSPEAEFPPHVGELQRIVDQGEAEFPGARSLAILRGGVLSLTDRKAAREQYAEATALGPVGMATSVYDLGAHTYFSGPEVWARRRVEETPLGLEALRAALTARPSPYHRPWLNLIWSVDPGFLRIYGPYWFNLAPYLMNEGIGVIMIVVGDPRVSAPVIAEARELIARTAWFHGLPSADSYAQAFAFVPVAVLEDVAEAKTFYASARYLMAATVIRETGVQAMILDADQSVRDPIGPFVRALKKADVGVTRSRGLAVLWPWRRNMAGTAWFAANEASLTYLARVRDYISAGLHLSPSWTLDQNAISFALEQAPELRVDDMAARARPLFQDKVRTVFERTYNRGPATPP